ncbi:MAG: DUF3137 domain-containing protein [Rhizobiaceae bacterium]|nr:DUF3137 domain-containing protein [Rhizobiaceae bacterium]
MDTKQFMPGGDTVARIVGDLERYEQERRDAHRKVQWRVPVFLGVFVVVVVALAIAFNSFADPQEQWFSTPHVFLYFGALVAAFFIYSAAMSPATKLQQSFRDHLMPIALGFVDNLRYQKGRTPDSIDRLPDQTVGTFNRRTFDDVFSGRYEGFPFELYEATLSHKAGKSESTRFRGVVVAFETITPFPGLLVATRKSGQVTKFFQNMFGGGGLKELQSGDAGLDDAYDFRTDHPDAALPLVTGRLAQALRWLGETWPDDAARIALRGRDGFLLLPLTKNFFELPGISTPLDYKAHIEPIVADMVSLLATASLVRKVGAKDDTPQSPAA